MLETIYFEGYPQQSDNIVEALFTLAKVPGINLNFLNFKSIAKIELYVR